MPNALFVAPSAYTLSGLATWLDYLIPGLRERGWDACLGLVSGPRHHDAERYLREHPTEDALVAHCATSTPEGRRRALLDLLRQARPDVAVSVNIPDLFCAIDSLRARQHPAPHAVLSVHGIEAYLYSDAKRYCGLLDAVVCTNRLACSLTQELGDVPPERVLYAPYGVAMPARERLPRSDELRIVYSGRLETPQKRSHDLVPMVAGLQARQLPFRLEIAGDGPERSSLESALAEPAAEGKVVFHGQLPADRLKAEVYRGADALIVTSFWETGPIVVWEAMAQGVPVVSSRYIGSGLESALQDGGNALLFPIGDADAAADALARLHREAGLAEHLVAGGLELVGRRYSIPASVAGWDDVLRKILAQPQQGAIGLPASAKRGRLDRWLGPGLAETLRERLPRSAQHSGDPGGEWPHSHHRHGASDVDFWELAQQRDLRDGVAHVG